MKNDKYSTDSLVGFLEAFDDEDLPDGAWWAMLEEGAESFAEFNNLKNYDANSMVHEYLKARGGK